jgi:hypothetical protein
MLAEVVCDRVGSRPIVRHSRPVLPWPAVFGSVSPWTRLAWPRLGTVVLAGSLSARATPARAALAGSAVAGSAALAWPVLIWPGLSLTVGHPAGTVGSSLAGRSRPVPRSGPARPAC